MPAVNLVNIAPSAPAPPVNDETGAQAFLHQKQDGVHSGKPIPRDPTATVAKPELGPRITSFSVPDHGSVFCAKAGAMVNRKLSPADQACAIVRDWAIHSDCAVPAFVLPASDSAGDRALAQAVLERFQAKQPDEAAAEAYGKAFQVAGNPRADRAFAYKQSAIALTPRLWVPGDEAAGLDPCDLIPLLAASEAQAWEETLAAIVGPTALVVNAGVDQSGAFINSTYMGLSANTTDPAGSDTSMTGEILTASGGLVPQAVSYSHTNGTGAFVASATHTANGSDSLPVTVAKVNLRTASGGGGTMRVHEKLTATATITSSGDALTTTYTLTSAAS